MDRGIGSKRLVFQSLPLREHFGMNMARTTKIIPRENGYTSYSSATPAQTNQTQRTNELRNSMLVGWPSSPEERFLGFGPRERRA